MSKKILALVSEPISGDALEVALGEPLAADDEVLVIAPALNGKLRFWVSDPDPAIRRAQGVADESVARLDADGVDAAGDTGESDPLQAIEDALRTFAADEVVLCTHREGELNWLEDGVVEDARGRFGDRAVRHLEVG